MNTLYEKEVVVVVLLLLLIFHICMCKAEVPMDSLFWIECIKFVSISLHGHFFCSLVKCEWIKKSATIKTGTHIIRPRKKNSLYDRSWKMMLSVPPFFSLDFAEYYISKKFWHIEIAPTQMYLKIVYAEAGIACFSA